LGVDVSGDGPARNDHVAREDLRLDVGALSDDQGVVGVDLPGEGTLDSDRTLDAQLSLEAGSPSEKCVDLVGVHLFSARHLDLAWMRVRRPEASSHEPDWVMASSRRSSSS